MADDKKKPAGKDFFPEVMLLLLGLFLIWIVWQRIEDYLYYSQATSLGSLWARIVAFFAYQFWPLVKIAAVIIIILCSIGISYNYSRLSAINKEERELYSPKKMVEGEEEPIVKNDRWERVITHINSANSSDWRLAIIEADVILDEILKAAGYHGDSLGERLKSVERSDFVTIDLAWEAHKIRNQVAHQGADFPLNEREAKRAISLYEAVFREFKVI